jgi:ABC-2 type transport system permease protein
MKRVIEDVTRLLAIIGKELTETVRRPGTLISLVAGPFLILAVFGLGYDSVRDPFRAVVVVAPGSGLPDDVAYWEAYETGEVDIVAVTPDLGAARSAVTAGEADLAVIAPADAQAKLEVGEQSVIRVEYAMIDPIRASYALVAAREIANETNRQLITRAVAEGREFALTDPVTAAEAQRISPEVVASPTRAEAVNLSPTVPGVVPFFGPAAVALILQHLAITLASMSLVKERTSGVIELFRISPVTASEIILGKLLAHGGLIGVVAVVTLATLVAAFGVPFLAPIGLVVAVVAALVAASLAVGLVIGIVADSERGAVQLALLALLASVFFSGLVLPVTEFAPVVQVLAAALPVTHGMALLQELLLTGRMTESWHLLALIAIAVLGIGLAWALLGRRMARI